MKQVTIKVNNHEELDQAIELIKDIEEGVYIIELNERTRTHDIHVSGCSENIETDLRGFLMQMQVDAATQKRLLEKEAKAKKAQELKETDIRTMSVYEIVEFMVENRPPGLVSHSQSLNVVRPNEFNIQYI